VSAALHLTFSMTLEEVIAGCEEAWQFFSGYSGWSFPTIWARSSPRRTRWTRGWPANGWS